MSIKVQAFILVMFVNFFFACQHENKKSISKKESLKAVFIVPKGLSCVSCYVVFDAFKSKNVDSFIVITNYMRVIERKIFEKRFNFPLQKTKFIYCDKKVKQSFINIESNKFLIEIMLGDSSLNKQGGESYNFENISPWIN